jgi:hypothetical protein
MSKEQTLYGVFYKSNGRLTKTPYLGMTFTEKSLGAYFKSCAKIDQEILKTPLHVRKLRNGKRH